MIHKRQFVIGNELAPLKDWQIVKIEADLYLSHCPTLPVGRMKDLNGKEWFLLGIAIQTDKEKADPLTQIGGSLTSDIEKLYKSWTGRWVLIGNNRLHLDCTGMLGCFYTKIQAGGWISSSLAILQEIGLLSPRRENLKHKFGIEWYPLPTSRFEGVHKLLPSQILNITTFKTEARPLPKPENGLSYDKLLDRITERLSCSLSHISHSGKRMLVPLTAGYDSRLVLAACCHVGLKVETFIRVLPTTSYSDLILSRKLSKASGIPHKYIKKCRFSKEKEDLFTKHTAGNTDHIVKNAIAYGQYDGFGAGDLILGGGVFEVARYVYWRKMGSNFSVETIFKGLDLEYCPESYNAEALTKWIEWVKQTPTIGLDWRDRLYLEQRVAGWASSIEQALDLIDAERLHVMNCHELISLFLSLPEEKRRTSQHHVDLIGKMFPVLLKYPFNPPQPTCVTLQKKILRLAATPLPEIYRKLHRFIFMQHFS